MLRGGCDGVVVGVGGEFGVEGREGVAAAATVSPPHAPRHRERGGSPLSPAPVHPAAARLHFHPKDGDHSLENGQSYHHSRRRWSLTLRGRKPLVETAADRILSSWAPQSPHRCSKGAAQTVGTHSSPPCRSCFFCCIVPHPPALHLLLAVGSSLSNNSAAILHPQLQPVEGESRRVMFGSLLLLLLLLLRDGSSAVPPLLPSSSDQHRHRGGPMCVVGPDQAARRTQQARTFHRRPVLSMLSLLLSLFALIAGPRDSRSRFPRQNTQSNCCCCRRCCCHPSIERLHTKRLHCVAHLGCTKYPLVAKNDLLCLLCCVFLSNLRGWVTTFYKRSNFCFLFKAPIKINPTQYGRKEGKGIAEQGNMSVGSIALPSSKPLKKGLFLPELTTMRFTEFG